MGFRFTKLIPILLLGPLIAGCASRPRTTAEAALPETTVTPVESPVVPERLVERVKRNGKEIEKYFFLDEDGGIHVKADLSYMPMDSSGTVSCEVIYDLENVETTGDSAGGSAEDSAYRVRFFIHEEGLDEAVEDTLIWRPAPGSAGLLLSLDDDYVQAWEEHLDLFDEYGARVTFFLQGANITFAAKAMERGHDVGYHSLSHLDLRKVSQERFMNETVLTGEFYRQAGVPLSSFAYPFGFSEPWMHETLLESYGVLRGYGTTFRLYREDQIRGGHIISRAIDNTVIRGDENFERLISQMLFIVKFLDAGHVLPLTSHDISDTAQWGISRKRLEFLLKTAVDLKLKFYLYRDFGKKESTDYTD